MRLLLSLRSLSPVVRALRCILCFCFCFFAFDCESCRKYSLVRYFPYSICKLFPLFDQGVIRRFLLLFARIYMYEYKYEYVRSTLFFGSRSPHVFCVAAVAPLVRYLEPGTWVGTLGMNIHTVHEWPMAEQHCAAACRTTTIEEAFGRGTR